MAKVTEIVAPFRGSKRRVVWVDGAEWRTTSADSLRAADVRTGLETSRGSLASAIDAEERSQARARALRLLEYRERSTTELRGRLLEDGYPEPVALAVVGSLEACGLVDDARFAGVAARTLVAVRGMGRQRALRELAAKGIDGQCAREAVDEALPPEEERERALTLARALATRPSATLDKVAARLVRKGYASSLALAAAREAFAEDPETFNDEPTVSESDGGPDLR